MKAPSSKLAVLPGGLLFSVFSALCFGFFALVGRLTGFFNILLVLAGIVPSVIFFAGLLTVCRKASDGEKTSVADFFGATGKHWRRFLLFGVIAYLLTVCILFAAPYYLSLMSEDFSFGILAGIYLLFVCVMTLALLYAAFVSVCYDCRLRDALKNGFKLIIKNLPKTLAALLLLLAVGGGIYAALHFTNGVIQIVLAVIFALVCPTAVTYLLVLLFKDGTKRLLGDYIPVKKEKAPVVITTDNTEDDYIFVDGKMIKNPNKE